MELTPEKKTNYAIHSFMLAQHAKIGAKAQLPRSSCLDSGAILEGRARVNCGRTDGFGRTLLSADDVMPGIPEMLHDVQVEATFADGTKLVTVHNPIV